MLHRLRHTTDASNTGIDRMLLLPLTASLTVLMQASTNTLLSHFVSLFFSLWLTRIISRGAGQPSGQVPTAAFSG